MRAIVVGVALVSLGLVTNAWAQGEPCYRSPYSTSGPAPFVGSNYSLYAPQEGPTFVGAYYPGSFTPLPYMRDYTGPGFGGPVPQRAPYVNPGPYFYTATYPYTPG